MHPISVIALPLGFWQMYLQLHGLSQYDVSSLNIVWIVYHIDRKCIRVAFHRSVDELEVLNRWQRTFDFILHGFAYVFLNHLSMKAHVCTRNTQSPEDFRVVCCVQPVLWHRPNAYHKEGIRTAGSNRLYVWISGEPSFAIKWAIINFTVTYWDGKLQITYHQSGISREIFPTLIALDFSLLTNVRACMSNQIIVVSE